MGCFHRRRQPLMTDSLTINEDVSCIQCGYNLRGLRESGRCPECNTDIAISHHADFLQVSDVLCTKCGHDLCGLSPAGQCPNCRTDISLSHNSNLLRFANPAWLRKVKFGFDLVVILMLLGVISRLTLVTLFAAIPSVVLSILGWGLAIGGYGAWLWALLSITAVEPRDYLTESSRSWRRMTRVFVVMWIVIVAAVYCLPSTKQNWLVHAILWFCGRCVIVGLYYSVLSYITQLAIRVPNPKLVRLSVIVKWATVIIFGLSALLSLAAMFDFSTPPGAGAAAAVGNRSFASNFTNCLGIVTFLLGIILILRYRSALKIAITQADRLAASTTDA